MLTISFRQSQGVSSSASHSTCRRGDLKTRLNALQGGGLERMALLARIQSGALEQGCRVLSKYPLTAMGVSGSADATAVVFLWLCLEG